MLDLWRDDPAGCILVLATGCFDLLHIGHIDLLHGAREAGRSRALALAAIADVVPPSVRLLVGLNSDESVRRLKGPGRPVVPLLERGRHLVALRTVDAVTVFTGDDPASLIAAVQPDIFVKGGDYDLATLPERAACEQVGCGIQIVPRRVAISTTELLARMKGKG